MFKTLFSCFLQRKFIFLLKMTRNYKAKKRSYARDALENAIASVRTNKRTVGQASEFFGVPRSTINNHVQNKVSGFQRGRKPALTAVAEPALVDMIIQMNDCAFELDLNMVIIVVANYVKSKNLSTPFKNGVAGINWIFS
jgi:hypothetical protein